MYVLVRFTDGVYHVAPNTEIKNRLGNEASVFWKKHRSFYLATIITEGSNKNKLMRLKKIYESGLEQNDEKETMKQRIIEDFNCCIPSIDNNNTPDTELINNQNNTFADGLARENISISETDSFTIPPSEFDTDETDHCERASDDYAHEVQEIVQNVADRTSFAPDGTNFYNTIMNGQKQENTTFIENIGYSIPQSDHDVGKFHESCETKENKINVISIHHISPPPRPPPNESIIDTPVMKKKYPVKEQFCIFCKKLVKRFGRHLTGVHKHELDVVPLFNFEKKSIERKKIIDSLRVKGNYEFNHENATSQIVARRSIYKDEPIEYTDCPSCFVRVSKVSLRRHYRRCSMNKNPNDNSRNTYVKSKKVTLSLHPSADQVLREHIFPVLRNDESVQIIRNDYLVILYGNKMVAKYRSPHHYKMIRANLRYIGRFLVEMKKRSNDIVDFMSCFTPSQYDNIVGSIKAVARFNSEDGEFLAPNTASTLGTILKFCSAILESDFIKKQNEKRRGEVENFLKLLRTEFPTDINKTAIENTVTMRRQKKIILPSTSDMKKFIVYLSQQRTRFFKILDSEFSFSHYKQLAGFTLVGIMVYNGRRPGETERLTISDFRESAQSVKENPELLDSQKKYSNSQYTRCVLRGKLSRNVSILLNIDEVNCINLILDCRSIAGVEKENPFVFGLPGKRPFKFVNAGRLLKQYAGEANLENSERFFATNIRKNLATKTTKLELPLEVREHIMNFMGHSEKIHKSIYRQPDIDKDIFVMPDVLNFISGSNAISSSHAITAESTSIGSSIEENREEIDVPVTSEIESMNLPCSSKDKNSREQFPNDRSLDEYSEYVPDGSGSESELELDKGRKKTKLIDMYLGYVPRRSWTTEERHKAREFFETEFVQGTSPSYSKCRRATKVCSALRERTPRQLRSWILNEMKRSSQTQIQKQHNSFGGSRKSWTTPEKKIVRREFRYEVDNGVYPTKKKIKRVLNDFPEFQGRTPRMMISHIQHAIKKNKMNSC